MARPLFFEPSRGTFAELTQLYSFVWPAAAGMWNLRWQVRGFLEAAPLATNEDLLARFVRGSGIQGAGNLRGDCVAKTWDEQQRLFAKFLLVDICALFESWITQVLRCLGLPGGNAEKYLQFPTTTTRGIRKGVQAAIDDITSPESAMLRATFYDLLKSSPKNSLANLENLLHCYRFFKECRNCLAHNGGIADVRAVDAYTQFAATAAALDVTEVPAHEATLLAEQIRLHLRGVVGFSDIVLRIVSTLDAELSRSARSERHLKNQWLARNGRRYSLKTTNAVAKSRQIQRLIGKLRLPKPTQTVALEKWLRAEQLVN